MPRPSRVAVAAMGVAAIVVAALVTGGVMVGRLVDPPSPTTTVVADDGSEIVLDWADLPADGWTDPADVLAAPRADDVERVGEQQLLSLQAAVDPVAPGLRWGFEPQGGATFEPMPVGGNGYGGTSLHQVYNSPTRTGAGLAADADWLVVADALEAHLAELGYGAIEWEHDREPFPHESEAERDQEVVRQFGSLDPDEMWMWSGTATAGSMWAWVSIWDERRDTAPSEPWQSSPSGVSLFLGGTVVAEADEQAYAEGVAPFEGLARPEPSHSD
ncbi:MULTISPECIES: hypothetical protein [unclassified Agrococcus]|uniref:hypothetical protein n=1 Tax=unclassified Agrococcus TaxID=2615065 RepID=UPI00360BA717